MVTINISNKGLYIFTAVIILIAVIGIISGVTITFPTLPTSLLSTPPNPGHNADSIYFVVHQGFPNADLTYSEPDKYLPLSRAKVYECPIYDDHDCASKCIGQLSTSTTCEYSHYVKSMIGCGSAMTQQCTLAGYLIAAA